MNFPPFLIVLSEISTGGVLTAWGLTSILKKQSAAVRHAIWLLATTSPLLTAAFFALGLHFAVAVLPPKQPQPIVLRASDSIEINTSRPNPALTGANGTLSISASAPQPRNINQTDGARGSRPTWSVNGYLLTWFIGLFCVMIKTILDHCQVRLFVRKRTFPAPTEVAKLAEAILAEMGMKKLPCLRLSTPSQVPFCYGILSPVVVLPAIDDLEEQALYLKHEFAHIMRWDLFWMFLGRVACGVCWFNPLIWIASDKVRLESEYVADDMVLAHGADPASYAYILLDLVQSCKMERRRLTLAMAQTKGLSRRIECIMDASVRRQLPSTTFLLTLTLATVLLAFSVICVRLVAADSSLPPPAAPIKPAFPFGVVAIKVVDKNKKPLPGALISPFALFTANGPKSWINPEDGSSKPTHDIVTDANGQASIPYVLNYAYPLPATDLRSAPTSHLIVQVTFPDYARNRTILSVTATEPDIVLQPPFVGTADDLWAQLGEHDKADNELMRTNQNSINALKMEYETQQEILVLQELVENFPKNPRYWQAKLRLSKKTEFFPFGEETSAGLQEIVEEKNVPAEVTAKADLWIVADKTSHLIHTLSPNDETWDSYEKLINDYCTRYPKQNDLEKSMVLQMWKAELETFLRIGNDSRYDALVNRLEANPDPGLQEFAKGMGNLKNKPLDLKFDSLSGEEVDLSKMKGKVVLLHFWAASSKACVAEIASVSETYKKFHDQGFDVIGISADERKDGLIRCIQENNMIWPEYYDGKGFSGNEVMGRLQVHGLPSMWLIDTNGRLSRITSVSNLESNVATLISTKD